MISAYYSVPLSTIMTPLFAHAQRCGCSWERGQMDGRFTFDKRENRYYGAMSVYKMQTNYCYSSQSHTACPRLCMSIEPAAYLPIRLSLCLSLSLCLCL